MIFKELDSKQKEIKTLNKLLKESSSEKQKALILKDLNLLKSGLESEKQNAYYIDFYLADSKNLIVLHDIRLDYDDRTAQIDHMLISRFGIEIFESKSFKGKVTINDDESLDVEDKYGTKSYPNPMEQSKRHADVLKKFIEGQADLGKRIDMLGGFNIDNIVLFHPETTITNKKLPHNYFRADTYISERAKEIDKTGVVQMFKFISKMINIDSVKELANLIKDAHKPIKFNYENKYRLPKPKQDTPIVQIQDKKVILKDETKKEQLKEGSECPFCKNKLVLRKGKNDISFLGCSSFPKCRFSRRVSKVIN